MDAEQSYPLQMTHVCHEIFSLLYIQSNSWSIKQLTKSNFNLTNVSLYTFCIHLNDEETQLGDHPLAVQI